ncbi:DUF1129 family protein [Paenibacillus sp. HW567]|uniref:DUF1129 family protein n=1 Tax=Paenibacillus sp. HW567 TaxID=1034769 RepID=UPI000371E496|nr:DUF1129 family protein [Paenibacillus sp. HW567]
MATAQELIQWNLEKRSKLTGKNREYYEEMLLYIRLSSGRSEQQTEELLLELLDHVMEAQEDGRSAEQVFGANPKAYCDELIGEIPREKLKKRMLFAARMTLIFLSVTNFFSGILGAGMYYLFDLGSGTTEFSAGSTTVIFIVDVLILYVFILAVMHWLKASTFRKAKTSIWREFLQMWVMCMLHIGLFVAVIVWTPDFGPAASIPTIALVGIGVGFYLISLLLKSKS